MFLILLFSIELNITPNPIEGKVNENIPFEAILLDESGKRIDGEIQLSVIPENLGRISGYNFVPEREGRGVLRCIARVKGEIVRDFSYIKIGKRQVRRIIPASAVLNPGESQNFKSNETGRVKWKVIPPEIGTIDNGKFKALRPGRCRVVALFDDGELRTALVKVRGIEEKLEIKPEFKHMRTGDIFRFTIEGKDDKKIKWEVKPSSTGEIDNQGQFRAISPGKAEVTAMLDGKVARAMVVVSGAINLRIIPEKVEVKTGETFKFKLKIGEGKNITEIPVKWKVIPDRAGTIRDDGTFKAGNLPIRARVVAVIPERFGRGIASSKINIISAGFGRIKIKPEIKELSVGQKCNFNHINENIPVRWKVFPEDLGKINSEGIFTPARNGSGFIIAEPLNEVNIKPGRAAVIVGEEKEIEIKIPSTNVIEGFGLPIKVESPVPDYKVLWRVSPSYAGRVNLNNKFISSELPENKQSQKVTIYGIFYRNRNFLGWAKTTITVVERK